MESLFYMKEVLKEVYKVYNKKEILIGVIIVKDN